MRGVVDSLGKVREVYRIAGLSPEVAYYVYNHNPANAYRALVERVFCVETPNGLRPPPEPLPGVFDERLGYLRDGFRRRSSVMTKIEREKFPLLYSGRRRACMQNAVNYLEEHDLEIFHSYLSSFVKAEKALKKESCPRLIQPRTPAYSVEVGCYLKHLEKVIMGIFKRMNPSRLPMIVKGLNARDTGEVMEQKWKRFRSPVAISFDANRFDEHVSYDALLFEHSIYKLFYPNDKYLAWLLKMQLINKGFIRFETCDIRYTRVGGRMSGDMNTSTGNCLLMTMMVKAYCDHVGLDAEIADNGDDCVIMCETADVALFGGFEAWMLDFGFEVTIEDPVYVFEHIDFCQTHPVWTEDGYVMVRNIKAGIPKDCMSVLMLKSEAAFTDYCDAIGNCGMSLTGGIPCYQEFYSLLCRRGVGARGRIQNSVGWECGFVNLAVGMHRKYQPIHDRTRISFCRAFGVEPEVQMMMEQHYMDFIIPPFEVQRCDEPVSFGIDLYSGRSCF